MKTVLVSDQDYPLISIGREDDVTLEELRELSEKADAEQAAKSRTRACPPKA